MKKVTLVFSALALANCLYAKTINLGVVLPLTGPSGCLWARCF